MSFNLRESTCVCRSRNGNRVETKSETRPETTRRNGRKHGNMFPLVVSARNPLQGKAIAAFRNKETRLRAHPPYPLKVRVPERHRAPGRIVCVRERVSVFPTRRAGARSGRNGTCRARQRTNARARRDVRQTCAFVAERRKCCILKRFHGSFPAQTVADRAGTSSHHRQSLFSVSDIFRR